uniref:Uncharacterized protein n=1 Tax=Roseihalotalea indica TaxID=2867963 RepID=A0AA49GIF6_9BACT|nr:hypothetical protein K4G66_23345 [Tunicatimonas sp. TK19036]
MSKKINTLYSTSKGIQEEISRLSELVSFSQERIRLSEKALYNTGRKIKRNHFPPDQW